MSAADTDPAWLRIRRADKTMLVQRKRRDSRKVGVDEIRKFAGTLLREGLPGNAGMLVALSGFTGQAISEGTELGITLIDGRALVRRIEQVRASEPCPNCATPMLLDHSFRGRWLRCPRFSEGCAGKRDLGREPARALELLLTAGR